MLFCSCILCKSTVTTAALPIHFNSVKCRSGGKQLALDWDGHLVCLFCAKECKSRAAIQQHERTCPHNPQRNYKNGMLGKTSFKKGRTMHTDPTIMQATLKLREHCKTHPTHGQCIEPEREKSRRLKISNTQKKNGAGGYRPNAGRSKKFSVYDSYGTKTTLQSTYELVCSEILMELGITWRRAKSLKYDGTKNYFADFYLPELDVYLDPKNDYKKKVDTAKIEAVIRDNGVKLYVLTKQQLTLQYIRWLLH